MTEEVFPADLSLFESSPLNVAYQEIKYVNYHTSSNLNTGGTLHFVIPSTARQYIDLKISRLCVQVKLLKDDDINLTSGDFFAPVNLTLHIVYSSKWTFKFSSK